MLNKLASEVINFKFDFEIFFKEKAKKISEELTSLMNCQKTNEESKKKIMFLKDQVKLLSYDRPSYSIETLIFSTMFFMTYPASYSFVRDSGLLTLPSPKYLSTFNKGNIETGAAKQYLKKQIEFLAPHEKYVCLLNDEIYVKPQFSYAGNKVLGLAENRDENRAIEAATTIQAFMICSLLSSYTDIVGLYPVKNSDSDYLAVLFDDILLLLFEVGYETIILITDNNRVNGKAVKIYTNFEFVPISIDSKYDIGKKMFFSYDTSHLLKCIRNIFQSVKTFHFPSLAEPGTYKKASISHLEKIYEIERFNTVKLAPQLSYKVLHTSNLDKQNVYLALCLFNKKNIEALKLYKDQIDEDVDGTVEFLDIIVNMWDIFNVSSPRKGIELKNEFMNPINSMSNVSIVYLKKL